MDIHNKQVKRGREDLTESDAKRRSLRDSRGTGHIDLQKDESRVSYFKDSLSGKVASTKHKIVDFVKKDGHSEHFTIRKVQIDDYGFLAIRDEYINECRPGDKKIYWMDKAATTHHWIIEKSKKGDDLGAEDEDDEYEAENSDDDGKSSKPQRSQRKGRKKTQANDEGSDIEDEATEVIACVTVGLKDNEVEQAYLDKDTVANWFKENRGRYGEIRCLYVSKKYRNQHVGSLLLLEAIKAILEAGREYVIAWLSEDGNKLAQDLSKVRGNAVWSKITEKLDGVDDDDLIYRVNLAALKKEIGAK